MVVTQLSEYSLPISQVHGSNPVPKRQKNYTEYVMSTVEKTKITEKEAVNGPFLYKQVTFVNFVFLDPF